MDNDLTRLANLYTKSKQLLPFSSHSLQLEKLIPQLEEVNKKLSRDSNVKLYLARKGINIEDHDRQLRNINIKYNSSEEDENIDLDTLLNINYDAIINSSIDESNKLVINEFRKMQNNILYNDWELSKQEFLISRSFSKVNVIPETNKSFSTNQSNVPSSLNANSELYAKLLPKIHKSRVSKSPIAVASLFSSVIPADPRGNSDREDMWSVIRWIVGEGSKESRVDSNFGFKKGPIYEKHFKENYLAGTTSLFNSLQQNSLGYLEDCFLGIVRGGSDRAPIDALTDIKEYSKEIYSKEASRYIQIDPSMFQSAVIYNCVRSGLWDEAIREASGLKTSHPSLVEALSYAAKKQILPENLWRSLISAYGEWKKTSNAANPYLQCLYLILGKLESRPPSSLTNLLGTTEDFLWFCLSNVWIEDSTLPSFVLKPESFSLQSLQIQSCGPKLFSRDGDNPLRYAIILLLTLQFELAIAYLLELNNSSIFLEAIHLCLTFEYYGLIKRADSLKSSIVDLTNLTINPVGLVNRYVEPFALTNSTYALDYMFLLISNEPYLDKEPIEASAQLLIKAQKFESLIGSYKEGVFQAGILFVRMIPEKAIAVVKHAAELLREKKDDVNAMKLLLLSKDFNAAGRLICQLLSDAFDGLPVNVQGQIKIAMDYLAILAQIGALGLDPKVAMLLDHFYLLTNFFQQFADKQYDSAISTLQELQICPFAKVGVDAAFQRISELDPMFAHHVPRVAVQVMTILHEQYKHVKASVPAHRFQSILYILNELKDQATTIAEFISRIALNISVPTYIMEQILTLRAQFN